MNTKLLRRIGAAFTAFSFLASIFILAGFFKNHGGSGIISGFISISPGKIGLSLLFAALSYFFLIFYDYLAVIHIGKKPEFLKCAAVSFTANAFGNSLGLSLLSSSAVRLRMYSMWRYTAAETAQVIAFCTLSSLSGFTALSAIILIPGALPASVPFALKTLLVVSSVIMVSALVLYILWPLIIKKDILLFSIPVKPPRPLVSIPQIIVSILEWAFAGAALYVLLPEPGPLPVFFAVYIASEFLGIISNIPGGLGVFDAAAISMLSPVSGSAVPVVSAIIMYRLIYYILPLAVSYFVYGESEAEAERKTIFSKAGEIKDLLSSTPGYVLSFFSFIAGAAMMLTGSIPAGADRVASLNAILPPALQSLSLYLCFFSGAGLLMLSRGLQKSVSASYILTLWLLVSGSFFLLLSGLSYEISALCIVLFGIMLVFKEYFFRKTGVFAERPTRGILFSITAVFSACAVIIYLSMPSGINALSARGFLPFLLSLILGITWMVSYIFMPDKPSPHSAPKYDADAAGRIAFDSSDAISLLSLSGDKQLLFSWSRQSFIMYAQCGSHFVALGDPYGPYAETEEMIWKFKRLARQSQAKPVFFNVNQENLHFYKDAMFNFYKIGDDAAVALEYYPVDRKKDAVLQSLTRRLETAGFSFRVLPRESSSSFLKSAVEVSKEWLIAKKIKEPGFIIGFFNQEYLRHFHIAAVYKQEKLIAFATVLSGALKDEFRIDMLRSIKGTTQDIERYIKYKLILWGKEKHFAFFNLGLTPSSSIDLNSYSPAWNKAGSALYNYGEKYRDIWSLRKEKDEFSPSWHPRYIVCENFMQVPSVFAEIALLTADKK